MTDQDEYSIGEIRRLLVELKAEVAEQRVEARESRHRLTNQINTLIGPVDVHRMQIAALEKAAEEHERELRTIRLEDIKALNDRVNDITTKAAAISGGIGMLGFLAQFVQWPWKH